MIHWCPDETAALAAILGSLSAVTAWLKAKVLTAGVDGCWVRDVYTSATWYGYEQLVWDGESLGRTLVDFARKEVT